MDQGNSYLNKLLSLGPSWATQDDPSSGENRVVKKVVIPQIENASSKFLAS